MGKGKYLLIITFILTVHAVHAQVSSLQVADSTSTDLYEKADWMQLITFGHQTIANGTDFPGLRLKIAYAYFITGNYKKALKEYDEVLRTDAYNETARYYAYYCNKYLNNDLAASYNAGYLDKESKNKEGLMPFSLLDAGVETSVKENNNVDRDNAFYGRIGISTRLWWRLQLEQSLAYYDQDIFRLENYRHITEEYNFADQQKEYYAKLSFAAGQHIEIIGAYHYFDTKFSNTIFNSNLGLAGIKYTGTYVDLQAGANFGRLDDKPIEQYNAEITFYPMGNFNFYTISKGSVKHLDGSNAFIFDQAVGFKLISNTWLESAVTFGNQDDYLDEDGLYVYNAIDNTTFKCGETLFYQAGNHAQIQLNYMYERKQDIYQDINYDQNSVTIGLLWKF